MATITIPTLAPVRDTRAIARSIEGIAMMPSMNRITMVSNNRLYPAIRPIVRPKKVLTAAALRPTNNEIFEPCKVRAKTSRPYISVPNNMPSPGTRNRLIGLSFIGSTVRYDASKAIINITNNSNAPITIVG